MSETKKNGIINGPARISRARASIVTSPKTESEKALESRLRKEVEKRGGTALKLLSQLHRGLPDRIVLLPRGIIYFVELKTTGKKPTLLQRHCHEQLRALGFHVYIIDSAETLESFLYIIDIEQMELTNTRR